MSDRPAISRTRVWAFRAFAVIYALFWLNVAFSAASDERHCLHELGYRVFFAAVLLIVPTLAQVRRPQRNVAAAQQVILAATAHMVATFIARYVDPLAYVLVAFAVLLGVLHPRRRDVFVPAPRTSPVTCGVAIAIVVPLTVFAATHAPQVGDSHWEDTLVFVMALISSIVVAAIGAGGRRIPAWTSAVALGGFGVASALAPAQSASWGRGWGIGAVAGAVALLAATESVDRRRALTPA